jgi:hypothetical protein
LLHVVRPDPATEAQSRIEVDEYVPFQWRSYDEGLGAGYVRLGNYSTRLLELAIAPHTQVLRGLTVVSLDELSPWPEFSIARKLAGLPVVSTSFHEWQIVDLADDFRVSVRRPEILVFWGALGACESYAFEQVHFLTQDGVLQGAWFTEVPDEALRLFLSHAGPPQE